MTTNSRVYRRHVGDDVPHDAVIVSIGGQTLDDMTVSVFWPAKGDVAADEEAQSDVPAALAYADEVAKRYRFQRVLVWIATPEVWQPEWGTLMA
jgi:hypothetical protein